MRKFAYIGICASLIGLHTQWAAPVMAVRAEAMPRSLASVTGWFSRYDQIRRDAQMSLKEKLRAKGLLDKAKEGKHPDQEDRAKAKELASSLANRYSAAMNAMKALPRVPETSKLASGYTTYFSSARQLFIDFDKYHGNYADSLRRSLLSRKERLEVLDRSNKQLDESLRKRFGISDFKG